MLLSISLIFITSLLFSRICIRLRIPPLVGMIIGGFLLGPSIFNVIDQSILGISDDLIEVALILVLTNAGLSMDIADLKKIGKPALLMCFVPALFEILAVAILGPLLLGLTLVEAILLGCILAPVAAAVCVPYMVVLINKGYGTKKKIPQIIIAGTSIDDVLVMVLFVTFLQVSKGGSFEVMEFITIPVTIILGFVLGLLFGMGFNQLIANFRMNASSKTIIFLGLAFFLAGAEKVSTVVPFSGVLALMVMGMTVYQKNKPLADKMNTELNKIWVFAEIILFSLVGASIDISVISGDVLLGTFVVLFVATIFRYLGVLISLNSTEMNHKEKLFCGISYLPKTTFQAALGAVPLANGLAGGQIILTVSVVSILVFAPLGSILIEQTYTKLLERN